jgi:predicted lipoprotein with Yx(FWY)xxD motif
MRKQIAAIVLGVSATFALSACGLVDLKPDKTSNNAPASVPASPAPDATAPDTTAPDTTAPDTAAPASAGPGLRAVESALGKIVANAKGFTLYRFDADVAKPSKPTCYGECAKRWPAYRWSADLSLDGVDPSVIGKVERTDGITQLTIKGWPVYLYAGDTEAGQANGQGLSGKWWAVTPQGAKAAAPAAGASNKSNYGY